MSSSPHALVVVALIAVTACGAPAPIPESDPEPLALPTPEALTSGASIDTFPRFSSDGRQLAYVSDEDGLRRLWVLPVGDGEPRAITPPTPFIVTPEWAPDGTGLAFVSDHAEPTGVWVTTLGGESQRVSGDELPGSAPDWSPSGEMVLYRHPQGDGFDLWLWSATASTSRQLTSGGRVRGAARWSPDGGQLVYVGDYAGTRSLFVMSAEGGEPMALTLDEGADYDPRWSPDGREVAFVSSRAGSPDIWVVSASGGGARPLTRGPGNDHDPVWSPDGRWLAFLSIQDDVSDVWVVPAAGGEPVRVTDDAAGQEHVRWMPDGSGVVFSRAERQSRLWWASVTENDARPLTDGSTEVAQPAVAPDGRRVAYVSGDGGHDDLFLIDLETGENGRLTSLSAGAAAPRWAPDGLRLVFESSQGGNSDLWLLELASGETTQLTTDSARDYGPVWSPAGNELAFTSNRSDGVTEVWRLALGAASPERVTFQSGTRPRWHPSGDRLLFQSAGGGDGRMQVWEVDLGTGEAQQLTDGDYGAVAEYSPGGDDVVFQEHTGARFQVQLQPRSGGPPRALGDGRDEETQPRWAPSGRRVAYLNGSAGTRDLVVVSPAGGERRVVSQPEAAVPDYAWTPDGAAVVFSQRETRTNLWSVNLSSLLASSTTR